MPHPQSIIQAEPVESLIRVIRGQRVILDADLARVYGVTTKRLNEAVKRNRERFPSDFMFQLTADEAANLRSQIATASDEQEGSRSQIVTLKRGQNIKYLPHAFTEFGAFQAARGSGVSRACHPEHSEGSQSCGRARRRTEILRFAQNDRPEWKVSRNCAGKPANHPVQRKS